MNNTHIDLTLKALTKLNLKEGLSLLDVGCGKTSNKIVGFKDYYKWVGVDSEKNSDTILACMEDMNMIDDNSFDIIFVCHSLEHCQHPIEALKEFKRIVKPNGTIFISSPLHCRHQILEADKDHIFVFTDIQFQRLLLYTGLTLKQQWVEWSEPAIEKNSSLITVCVK